MSLYYMLWTNLCILPLWTQCMHKLLCRDKHATHILLPSHLALCHCTWSPVTHHVAYSLSDESLLSPTQPWSHILPSQSPFKYHYTILCSVEYSLMSQDGFSYKVLYHACSIECGHLELLFEWLRCSSDISQDLLTYPHFKWLCIVHNSESLWHCPISTEAQCNTLICILL